MIENEEENKEILPDAKPLKKKLWRRIIKAIMIFFIIILILAIGTAGFVAYRLSQEDIAGWRLNVGWGKVETEDYHGYAPSLAFRYPKIFEIDTDSDEKYGKGYAVGLKLKTDERTGCDIRVDGPKLDFSQDENKLAEQIVNPIKEKSLDFNLLEKKKITIGGKDAMKVSFSFLDPIGARVRLDQVFVKSDNVNYMIICGTGEYQYDFFKKDFQVFYDSINFKGELIKPEVKNEWRKLFDFRKDRQAY